MTYIISAVGCPPLSNIPNGVVVEFGRSTGDNATYSCESGFELVGVPTRFCQSNGQWSDEPPTCVGNILKQIYAATFLFRHA